MFLDMHEVFFLPDSLGISHHFRSAKHASTPYNATTAAVWFPINHQDSMSPLKGKLFATRSLDPHFFMVEDKFLVD